MGSIIEVTCVNHPESGGQPMGETDLHRKEMIRQMQLLERFFAKRRVYVSGDLRLYYEQGNPKKSVVPDVFVVKGPEPRGRRVYKLWVGRPAAAHHHRDDFPQDEEEGQGHEASAVRAAWREGVLPV